MSTPRRNKPRAPRRAQQNGNTEDVNRAWNELELSLRQIRTKQQAALAFEHIYRNAYRIVLKREGEMLYNNYTKLETEWLTHNVQPGVLDSVKKVISSQDPHGTSQKASGQERMAGEELMRYLKAVWEDQIVCTGYTTDVLMYMDRVYTAESRRMKVFPMTMGLFRNFILFSSIPGGPAGTKYSVLSSLIRVVLAQIEMERNGDVIDQNLVRSCMYMLEGLYETDQEEESTKIYLTRFLPEFLKESTVFFQAEGQRLCKEITSGAFCKHAMNRLREEEQRCGSTLPKSTMEPIRDVVHTEMIAKNIVEVIKNPTSGVAMMLDNDNIEELKDIYTLISRVDSTKAALKTEVQKRIVELGNEINATASATATVKQPPPPKPDADTKSTERPQNQQTVAAIQWVNEVLALKDRYDMFLTQAFDDDKGLQTAFTNSFTEFINNFPRGSEYLSLFFDENMKKGIKGKSEQEVDQVVDKGIVLLRYISDKDLFETYYKKHLARRLIQKKSASMDAEKQIVIKMKLEVGNAMTSKIDPMFRDMDTSDGLTKGYREHAAKNTEGKSGELDIHVLTNTMWPLEGLSFFQDGGAKVTWPTELNRIKESFSHFYHNQHTGRKLLWAGQLGTVDIRAYFPLAKSTVKTRELNCSTYAAIILLLFQDLPDGATLTSSEIQARTGIPDEHLIRNLQALAVAPKTRVLLKEPMSRDIKPEDKFSFNASFSSQYNKIKIGVVAANKAETADERKATTDKNDDQRQHVIDAAVVRVMKQRKELGHTELILEVVNVLRPRFKPDIPMLKKRIESLIEREYLERIGEDAEKPAYRYLA